MNPYIVLLLAGFIAGGVVGWASHFWAKRSLVKWGAERAISKADVEKSLREGGE